MACIATSHQLVPRLLCLCLLIVSSCNLSADTPPITIISSGDSPVYNRVISSLNRYIRECQSAKNKICVEARLDLLSLDQAKNERPVDSRLLITLGRRAAEWAARNYPDRKILMSLIPRAAYQKLISNNESLNSTAIYLDQPLQRLYRLLPMITQEPKPGVLLGEDSRNLLPEIEEVSDQFSLPTNHRTVLNSDRLGLELRALLSESNLLLALPDSKIYNSKTVFNILLSSYHQKVPVIGFSAAYAKAGALVAVYSAPEDVGHDLAEYLADVKRNNYQLIPPRYPRYFRVSINKNVASSLDIELPDETRLMEMLQRGGKQ